MTAKQQLHQLIEQPTDEEASLALALLEGQFSGEPRSSSPPPAFFGMLRSGKNDPADGEV